MSFQNIAVIVLLLVCIAVLFYLLFLSFKLLKESQKKIEQEKKNK